MSETTTHELNAEFKRLLDAARGMTSDVSAEVNKVLLDGVSNPLDPERAERLLTLVIETLRAHAKRRGDSGTDTALAKRRAAASRARRGR